MIKLNLDREMLDRCREYADTITHPVLVYVNRHSTTSVERAVLRLLGFSDAYEINGSLYPVANLIIDKIGRANLKHGVPLMIAQIKKRYPRWTQQKMAEKIIRGEVNFDMLEDLSPDQIKGILKPWIDTAIRHIDKMRHKKDDMRYNMGVAHKPLKYVSVGSGDLDADIQQATLAAEQGADIIAVMRSSAQSLLDYVPCGEVSEGFGGTFATQENFRIMREVLYELSSKLGRYIRVCHYSSGLCMPELSVIGAEQGIDYLVNDSLYAVLFRDINVKRTMIDQHFSRMIVARAGITINTSEDNYLKISDASLNQHQVLASHFMNECLARSAGMRDEQIGLAHSFEMNPNTEDCITFEIAMSQLVREVFSRCSIKYLPPTRYKKGDVFFNPAMESMFNVVGAITGVDVHCLGTLDGNGQSQAPVLRDCFQALKNAQYIFDGCQSLKDEFIFASNGKITRQARQILENAHKLLKRISNKTLFDAVEEGAFANISRSRDQGKGFDGVFEKSRRYYNPFLELILGAQGRR